MEISKLQQALSAAGFIKETKDDEGCPSLSYLTHNELGVYVGDVLVLKGFIKIKETIRGKEWIMYKDKISTISHRPGSSTFAAIANKDL